MKKGFKKKSTFCCETKVIINHLIMVKDRLHPWMTRKLRFKSVTETVKVVVVQVELRFAILQAC